MKEVIPFLTKSFPTIQLNGSKECHVKIVNFKKTGGKPTKTTCFRQASAEPYRLSSYQLQAFHNM